MEQSPYRDIPDSPEEIRALKLIQAKLAGFTDDFDDVLKKFPVSDTSEYARYARAIAYFRYPDIENGLKEINSLLQQNPANPYFHELKGQMLYENGDVIGALPSLETATQILPYEPLILTLYGTALVSTNRVEDLKKAIEVLRTSVAYDPNNSSSWYQLAIAYNRLGDTANTALATAERFLLLGNLAKAKFHAQRAQELMKAGSPGSLRAEDIISLANRKISEKNN
ncbi:tetratricopeptide repeat protein [Sneathiella glossodoripedis]|uniref:tetratricopeptide repeat protein n=1 Tax=Sneathiella glossodoripedis TaxID=418853 RepID=UPI000688AC68|nr:tetratricopeptide repeat protein [Sneathiella glossodoripedis]